MLTITEEEWKITLKVLEKIHDNVAITELRDKYFPWPPTFEWILFQYDIYAIMEIIEKYLIPNINKEKQIDHNS